MKRYYACAIAYHRALFLSTFSPHLPRALSAYAPYSSRPTFARGFSCLFPLDSFAGAASRCGRSAEDGERRRRKRLPVWSNDVCRNAIVRGLSRRRQSINYPCGNARYCDALRKIRAAGVVHFRRRIHRRGLVGRLREAVRCRAISSRTPTFDSLIYRVRVSTDVT